MFWCGILCCRGSRIVKGHGQLRIRQLFSCRTKAPSRHQHGDSLYGCGCVVCVDVHSQFRKLVLCLRLPGLVALPFSQHLQLCKLTVTSFDLLLHLLHLEQRIRTCHCQRASPWYLACGRTCRIFFRFHHSELRSMILIVWLIKLWGVQRA